MLIVPGRWTLHTLNKHQVKWGDGVSALGTEEVSGAGLDLQVEWFRIHFLGTWEVEGRSLGLDLRRRHH